MDLQQALEFAAGRGRGVLVTLHADGRPHASNVLFASQDRLIKVSLTADRVKTHNVRRDPRVLMHVTDESFWRYAVLEGTAELNAVASRPDDPAVEALVEYYRALSGEHPDWDDYRRAMVADRRQLLTLTATRAYGQLPG